MKGAKNSTIGIASMNQEARRIKVPKKIPEI